MVEGSVRKITIGLIATLLFSSLVFGQAPQLRRSVVGEEPVWTITHINGGVYRASTNNHGTVFLVTQDGIVLADPLSLEFSVWLKGEFETRFEVPVKYVVYSHYHWDHASGGEVFADTARFVGHANMLSYLEMPPPSTTLQQVIGQYQPVAALDANGNGVIDQSEVPDDFQRFPGSAQSQFEGFDEDEDGVLSGAEVVRGPLRFVHPPDIRYSDEFQISLGGKRVRLTWVGDMNHSSDTSLITFPDDDVMLIVDYVSQRLPNREMDYELGKFPEWEDGSSWREYLEKLRDAGATGIATGQTLEDMQRDITMDEYSDWEGFDWVDENVLGMYHFLTD